MGTHASAYLGGMLPLAFLATLATLPLATLGGLGGPQSSAPASLELSAKNSSDWANFIRPNADELTYETIGWRNAFWPAVEEARRLGRPILLWTMNGHPLGCT